MIDIDTYSRFKKLSEIQINSANEEYVKIHVVIEILRLLGHTSNIDFEVNYKSDRPDIILSSPGQPIIIEVKSPSVNIRDYIDQIKRYSLNFNPFLSILTNGKIFYFFSPDMRKRANFEDKLILSFKLDDLSKKDIVDKIALLLSKNISFEQAFSNLESIEKDIESVETNIEIKEKLKSSKEQRIIEIEEKYPNLLDLIKVLEHLNPDMKKELREYLDEKNNLTPLGNEISGLKNYLPNLINSTEYSIYKSNIINNYSDRKYYINRKKEDFELGYVNEAANILAVQEGKQIIICGHKRLPNDKVFLVPTKYPDSKKFMPSEHGEEIISAYGQRINKSYKIENKEEIKESNEINYVAIVDYIPNVPGRNEQFLQELYDIGEFNLWDIKHGPLKYFTESKMSGIFLVLRSYKMPFAIYKNEDFSYVWNGKSQHKPKIIREETRKKIVEGFKNREFTPVLSDDEYKKRVNTINQIVRKYR
ncbi:MAG: type I restriction enzyme HsdR N-terminal domain-containing protein [Methanofastidiosum sp.]